MYWYIINDPPCNSIYAAKRLINNGPKGNSEFCFPETLNVPRGEAEGNIEVSFFAANKS